MLGGYIDCHACACIIRGEEASCPFCGATQVRAGAPLWLVAALVGGLGLVDVACDEASESLQLRELSSTGDGTGSTSDSSATGTSTSTGASSTGTSTTSDSTTTEDPNPDGSTYAGPDEGDSISTGPWTTSTGEPDASTGPQPTTTGDSSFPDGATYAGPDENSSVSESLSDSYTSDGDTGETGGSSGSSGGSDEQEGDKACACDSRARPGHGLLGLLLLGVLRRRRRRG